MLKNDDDLAKTEIVKADGQLCKPQSKALDSECGQTVSDNCENNVSHYIHDTGRKLRNMVYSCYIVEIRFIVGRNQNIWRK